jgi:hypothetical protein
MWAEAYEHDERVQARTSAAHAVTRLFLLHVLGNLDFLSLQLEGLRDTIVLQDDASGSYNRFSKFRG